MHLNSDFTQRVVIRPDDYEWRDSPASGVKRMMLDRIGDEVARATTIVEFAPGSYFDAHTHDGGEEYLVLEGVFSDESGDYPAGHYVRNPIGTSHKPHTKDGARILVKLHQFDATDTEQKSVDTTVASFAPGPVQGMSILSLHDHISETVRLVRLAAGTHAPKTCHHGGAEIYVLEGMLQDEAGFYPAGTWLRVPHLSEHSLFSDEDCLFYIKTGHLRAD
ncbi:cupin domain-containing protein [Shimia ponticola]|uniref:cupin domain-containing protein n=1 Tax=Shimia ponticola TaxID=2582893 RepID=UPI0011BDC7A1|nr:cupin domain-containing protein [Shimia ponticola]